MTIYELTGISYLIGELMSLYQYIGWYQHTGYCTFIIREEGLEF